MKVPGWVTKYRASIAAVVVVVVVLIVGHSYLNSKLPAIPANVLPLLAGSQAATTSTPATSGVTATTTKTPQAKPAASSAAKLSSQPTVSTTTIAAQELAGSGTNLLNSLVNIVCLSGNQAIPSISGSGVIIDSRGIILTAAHVAQLFLLQDYLGINQVECIVRSGSPARRAYFAEPIYVSPTWVKDNPDTLKTTSPEGTGENDFALLGITATATTTPLPSSFPAVPLAQTDPQAGEQVAIASYGAEYLTDTELNYDLYPILVFGSIADLYTFDTSTVDLFSVTGSAASQEGSSGGGMVNAQGQLIGTITTSSVSGSIATRELNAITIGHMRRSYGADTGQNLDAVLASESVPELIANFKSESDQLGALLAQSLNVN